MRPTEEKEQALDSACIPPKTAQNHGRPGNPVTGYLVRLRTHSHCGVEVPVRLKIHWPVTEGYCVVATRGGELPEVNCQSVTKLMQRQQQRKLKQQVGGMRLSGQREIRAVAQASYERVLAPARKASDTATCAKQTVSHKKGHLAINRSKETEWQEA